MYQLTTLTKKMIFPECIEGFSIGTAFDFWATPYILETLLKLRGKLKKQSFGKPNKDDSLEMPYEKIYGLEHLAIFLLKKVKRNVYEKDVTLLIYAFQIIVIVLGLIIFKESIFM